ncbi:MAG: GNAT family N-acetyltransferase [Phycisphaeraceae bacterium]|nr:GNAT family N-acetyltransferase [Phycisphaeraceae bacterium]
MGNGPVSIRAATPADVPEILALIRELAEYEKAPEQAVATEGDLRRHLFGNSFDDWQGVSNVPKSGPVAECLIGEIDSVPQGLALFYANFSTWVGKPGIYLEDLFVRPAARGRGLGKALFVEVASIAAARGCQRLEWSVLDWNTPAIDFYRALGATPMSEWTVHRLAGDRLAAVAATKPQLA